jgi:hypothetical protein
MTTPSSALPASQARNELKGSRYLDAQATLMGDNDEALEGFGQSTSRRRLGRLRWACLSWGDRCGPFHQYRVEVPQVSLRRLRRLEHDGVRRAGASAYHPSRRLGERRTHHGFLPEVVGTEMTSYTSKVLAGELIEPETLVSLVRTAQATGPIGVLSYMPVPIILRSS